MLVTTLVVDLITVAVCAAVLLRRGRLAHSHPGTIYLVFHLLVFSFRTFSILRGAPTLFTDWGWFFMPVSPEELARAVGMADVALVAMTAGWLKASSDDLRTQSAAPDPTPPANLQLRYIWRVVVFAFPIGVVGLLALGNVPGVESLSINLGRWETSSWLSITQVWAGLALLALIYWYGFRWWLVTPMALYLMVMLFQGYHRFRVIIPILLMIQIFLDRRRLRWPRLWLVGAMVAVALIFYPMKTIGHLLQEGAAFEEISTYSRIAIDEALVGQADDQQFLDQYASTLTLVDRQGRFYLGSSYLALITLPIPRQFWADKPGLADLLADISVPWRPMSQTGMIMIFLGELYANFWYVGTTVGPLLLAYGLGRVYFRAYRYPYLSVARFSYLLLACNLIQVYRDGLTSIIVFTFVNMMPLMGIVLLHRLPFASKSRVPARPWLVQPTQPARRLR